MNFKQYQFATKTGDLKGHEDLSKDLNEILEKHLKEKNNISSVNKSLTTKIFRHRDEVVATYIQSNLPRNRIDIHIKGELYICSAVIYLFGEANSQALKDLKKELDDLEKNYHI